MKIGHRCAPCWCGSGLIMFFRTLVRGRLYRTCLRCYDWRFVQATPDWDDMADEVEGDR